MFKYNMPVNAREKEQKEDRQISQGILYKPRPFEVGSTFTNELFIPLYQPDRWRLFNPTESDVQKYNMVPYNPLAPVGEDSPLYTYHLRVPVHTIEKYQHPNGSSSFLTFICPTHFNDYLVNVLGKKPLFNTSVCPFCKAASDAWDEHNFRWSELEAKSGVVKKGLNQEGYYATINSDPILKDSYDRAKRVFGVSDRYILNVFDYGVLVGHVPQPEDGLKHQIWLAPKSVFTSLNMLFEEDDKDSQSPFFDMSNPSGLQIMKVIKDTSRCKGNNFKETQYTVMKGSRVQPDAAWAEYMTNIQAMADPSSVISILSDEEMSWYTRSGSKSVNLPISSTPVPAMTPPVPAMLPPDNKTSPNIPGQVYRW